MTRDPTDDHSLSSAHGRVQWFKETTERFGYAVESREDREAEERPRRRPARRT
jgi:hypothetical protein